MFKLLFALIVIAHCSLLDQDTCKPSQPTLFQKFPSKIQLDPSVLEKVNSTLLGLYKSLGNIPCLSFGVQYGDSRLLTLNYGICNTTSNAPASSSTLFRIASLTKIFTGLFALYVSDTPPYSLDTQVETLGNSFLHLLDVLTFCT